MAVYYQVHFITGKPKHKYYSLFFRSRQKKKRKAELGPEEICRSVITRLQGRKKAMIQLTKIAANCLCILQAEED